MRTAEGLYAKALDAEELAAWGGLRVDTLDDEIRFQKIIVRRAALKLRAIEGAGTDDYETGFEPAEEKQQHAEVAGADGEKRACLRPAYRIKRRPDFRAIHDRAVGRLVALMLQQAKLSGGIAGAGVDDPTPEETTREIQATLRAMTGDMDAPDSALDPA
jgi:hypothetical protein